MRVMIPVVELVVALAVDGSVDTLNMRVDDRVSSSETRFPECRREMASEKTYRESLLEVRNGEPGGEES
jgi:hypothetical protein